ncbi:MAG TPA: MBL fold metallo-hydrolase [Desulfomonilaceae bacterium]|nr:MBL fold metallo-hydrolase [Desulfomonilaceae bacterium]
MIENVIEGVQWIPGRDKFLPDSHMYVIGKPDSGDFTLVDCGLMEMGSYKLQELENFGITFDQVKRVIMTHTHLDHVGCLPEILEAIPHVEVWVHKDEADYLEAGDDRIVFGNAMFESMIRSQYTLTKDFFRIKVHRKLEGGESFSLGGVEFAVIHLPGHSTGSIGLFNEEYRWLMSGDTIYADGAIGRYDLVSADPAELKQSLERIAGLGVDMLLPCHNRIVRRGADPMVRNTVHQWSPILG